MVDGDALGTGVAVTSTFGIGCAVGTIGGPLGVVLGGAIGAGIGWLWSKTFTGEKAKA